jgi:hypothetical protein
MSTIQIAGSAADGRVVVSSTCTKATLGGG